MGLSSFSNKGNGPFLTRNVTNGVTPWFFDALFLGLAFLLFILPWEIPSLVRNPCFSKVLSLHRRDAWEPICEFHLTVYELPHKGLHGNNLCGPLRASTRKDGPKSEVLSFPTSAADIRRRLLEHELWTYYFLTRVLASRFLSILAFNLLYTPCWTSLHMMWRPVLLFHMGDSNRGLQYLQRTETPCPKASKPEASIFPITSTSTKMSESLVEQTA